MDAGGRVAIKPTYRDALGFRDSIAVVWNDDGVARLIDPNEDTLVRFKERTSVSWAADDRLWVYDWKQRLHALYDVSGKQLTPFRFQEVRDFRDGFAVVAEDGQWQFPGFLEDATYSYIDKSGKNRFERTFDELAWSFRDGRAIAGDEVIDTDGKTVFQRPTGSEFEFSDGLLAVQKNYGEDGETHFFNRDGVLVLQVDRNCENFSEGLAPFRVKSVSDGKVRWGYIDRDGNEVIKPRFTSAQPFSDGLAAVGIKKIESTFLDGHLPQERIGFIDRQGKIVIDPLYNEAGEFENGTCVVHQGGYQPEIMDAPTWWEKGRWVLIDRTGRQLAVTRLDQTR